MKLTPEEHAIVSAITRQYRQQHAGAGRREIMEAFNRAAPPFWRCAGIPWITPANCRPLSGRKPRRDGNTGILKSLIFSTVQKCALENSASAFERRNARAYPRRHFCSLENWA